MEKGGFGTMIFWQNDLARAVNISKRSSRKSGSVMLEFVLSFPIVLSLLLACIQFSHIWLARQVVHYSAYCAARATLVSHKGEYQPVAERAAEVVCAWIVKGHSAGESDRVVPGWGGIPGSGAAKRKTRVEIDDSGWNVSATVEHQFALIVPIAGPMIGWAVNPWRENSEWLETKADETGNVGDADILRHPHILFTETVSLPKPYVTVTPTKW